MACCLLDKAEPSTTAMNWLALRAFDKTNVFMDRVRALTSFGMDNTVCPEKAPDETKLAKALMLVMSSSRPALMLFDNVAVAFASAVSRLAICIG